MVESKGGNIFGTILASVVLATIEEKPGPIKIKDVSKKLVQLKDSGIDIDNFSLRYTVGGYYSEDVAMFLGNFLLGGLAVYEVADYALTSGGIAFCRNMLIEAHADPEQRKKLEKILETFKIDISTIKEKYQNYLSFKDYQPF